MQTTIRKRRCNKKFRILRGFKIASFALVLSSCSLFQQEQDPNKINFSKKLKLNQEAFCKKASGRGRIVLGSESNRFTFQSSATNDTFEIAIDIPFKGQETLILPLSKPFKFSGSLYEKSLLEIDASSKAKGTRKILNAFLFRTAKFVSLLNGRIDSAQCSGEKCIDGIINFEESNIDYEAPLSKLYVYSAKTNKTQNTYFSKLSFRAQSPDPASKPLLALDLIVDVCESR